MRENSRGSRNYADNACTPTPDRIEKNAEPLHIQKTDSIAGFSADANRPNSEGMIYLDIVQRFAL